jgi:hypothetical protein
MPPTEAQKRANKKYRENNRDKVRELTNEYVKNYYKKHKLENDDVYEKHLEYARGVNNWKYFINNTSMKKEQQLFLNILL